MQVAASLAGGVFPVDVDADVTTLNELKLSVIAAAPQPLTQLQVALHLDGTPLLDDADVMRLYCGCVLEVWQSAQGAALHGLSENYLAPNVAAFLTAVDLGDADECEMYLDACIISVDESYHGSPLLHAAAAGSDEVVEMLLRRGARVDYGGSGATTPLHAAVELTVSTTASILLRSGADPAAKDSSGASPLEIAEGRSNAATCKALRVAMGEEQG